MSPTSTHDGHAADRYPACRGHRPKIGTGGNGCGSLRLVQIGKPAGDVGDRALRGSCVSDDLFRVDSLNHTKLDTTFRHFCQLRSGLERSR